jgi:hypothetical protein
MRSGFRSLGWRRAVLMMCLLAFAGLITVSVINSHANHEKCVLDARLATLTTLAKAGQASWCSGEDWIEGGA